VEQGIKEACPYVTDVTLFDVYEGIQLGANKKSMAFSVVFTPQEEEFTSTVVDGFVEEILQNLNKLYEITLRS
jgi:phenylalanyl-tRNA synthetase beta chain